MKIDYRADVILTAEQLASVFEKSGIRRPTRDIPRLQRMIDNASLTITAWDNENLVGVARAMTDFSYCCYLSDLAVDRAYQGTGIGRELVHRVRAAIGEECNLLLVSAPEAMDFYQKIGLAPVQNGWMVKRSK